MPWPALCLGMQDVLPRHGGGPRRDQPPPQAALGAGQQPSVGLSTALRAGRMARVQGLTRWDAGVRGPQSRGLSSRLLLQMDTLEDWEALPCSRVTQGEGLPTPALPPLPRLEATQAAAVRYALAAPTDGSANVTKLPALPAAATSGSSLRGRARAVGPAASGRRELVPPAWRILSDRGMAVRAERWGPAPHSSTTRDVPLESTVQSLVSGVLSHIAAASRGPGQQLVAQGHLAHTTGLATPTRTAQVQAGDQGHSETLPAAAPEDVHSSAPPSPTATLHAADDSADAGGTAQGIPGNQDPVAGAEGQGPAPHGLLTSDTSLEELEEEWHKVLEGDAAGEAASDIKSASLAPLTDGDAESCLARGPRDQEHSEPLPATVPEDTSFSTSPSPGAPREEGHSVPLSASALPEAQSLAPPLPAAMPQLGDVGGETVGATQGILSDQGLAARGGEPRACPCWPRNL